MLEVDMPMEEWLKLTDAEREEHHKEWEKHHKWKLATHQFCDECFPFKVRKGRYL